MDHVKLPKSTQAATGQRMCSNHSHGFVFSHGFAHVANFPCANWTVSLADLMSPAPGLRVPQTRMPSAGEIKSWLLRSSGLPSPRQRLEAQACRVNVYSAKWQTQIARRVVAPRFYDFNSGTLASGKTRLAPKAKATFAWWLATQRTGKNMPLSMKCQINNPSSSSTISGIG